MHRIHLILMSACVLVSHSVYAQAVADSAAFHRGQWGVEFLPSTSISEAGVLRFNTPTRAWVLDGSAGFDRETASGGSLPGDQTSQSLNVNARLGPRWYHTANERVLRFLGLGVTGGYASARQTIGSKADYWSAGAYGELGLQYLFTRHLGLGGRATLTGSRSSQQFVPNGQGGTTQRVRIYHVGLQPLQIIGTFYF